MSVQVEFHCTGTPDSRLSLYKGVEVEAVGPRITIAWMTAVDPPYRTGRAIRIRIGECAWHYGVSKRAKKGMARPTDVPIEQIKTWQ